MPRLDDDDDDEWRDGVLANNMSPLVSALAAAFAQELASPDHVLDAVAVSRKCYLGVDLP
jgi:hypothetical protein